MRTVSRQRKPPNNYDRVHADAIVRRDSDRGGAPRTPGGASVAAGGSCRRPSRGPAACCTPRPPPRSPRPRRSGPPRGRPASSWAPWRSSSATWCVGFGTTPEGTGRRHLNVFLHIGSHEHDALIRVWVGDFRRRHISVPAATRHIPPMNALDLISF